MDGFLEYRVFDALCERSTNIESGSKEKLEIESDRLFYPNNEKLENYFSSSSECIRYSAAQLVGFLHDIFAVESKVIIPFLKELHLLPYRIPPKLLGELFQLVEDQASSLAQAQSLANSTCEFFDLRIHEEGKNVPLCLRQLSKQSDLLSDPVDKVILKVVIAVVTQTSLPKALTLLTNEAVFHSLVTKNCRHLHSDITIRTSKFKEVAYWLWSNLNEEKKKLVAAMYARATIAISSPDIDRLAFYYAQTMDLDVSLAKRVVSRAYDEEFVRQEISLSARPIVALLKELGILELESARRILTLEGIELE